MNERLALRVLIWLAITVLAFWASREIGDLIGRFGRVIALFLTAWLISFVLGPPAEALVRARVRRPLAVFAVYVLAFTVLFLGALLLVPVFAGQLGQMREGVNAYTAQTPALLTLVERLALDYGISQSELQAIYRSLVDQGRAFTGQVLQNTIGWLTSIATLMVDLIFCLIISVYMMLDGRRILAAAIMLAPRQYRVELRAIAQDIADNFGGYIRGTLILSVIYGASIGLFMTVVGLDYKASSALFAGVALVIPFVGPFVSLAPTLLVAVLTRPGDVWWIALLLILTQQIVLNVAGPRVFGRTVNMHPLLVIGAALTGAALAGIGGALLGIPIAGIIASVVKRFYNRAMSDDEQPAPAVEPAPSAAEPVDVVDPIGTVGQQPNAGLSIDPPVGASGARPAR